MLSSDQVRSKIPAFEFTCVSSVTEFVQQFTSDDNTLAGNILNDSNWNEVGQAIGPLLLLDVYSQSTDDATVLFTSKVLSVAYRNLFPEVGQLDKCVEHLLSCLLDQYEVWNVNVSADVMHLIVFIVHREYLISKYLSSIPSMLYTEASNNINSGRLVSNRICCLTFDLLTLLVNQFHCDLLHTATLTDEQAWIYSCVVRKQFDEYHLHYMLRCAANAMDHITAMEPELAKSVIRFLHSLTTVCLPTVEHCGSKGQVLKLFRSNLMSTSLFEALWSQLLARIRESSTFETTLLFQTIEIFIQFPSKFSLSKEDSELKESWIPVTLFQSALLLQQLLRQSEAQQGGHWIQICHLIALIKPQYSLLQMSQEQNCWLWIQSVVQVSSVILQNDHAPALRREVMMVWSSLASAVEGSGTDCAFNREVAQHLDVIIDLYFANYQRYSYDDDCDVDDFSQMMCCRQRCICWKERVWDGVVQEIIKENERLTDFTIRCLLWNVHTQCAVMKIVESGGCSSFDNKEAIAKILFQTLSILQGWFDRGILSAMSSASMFALVQGTYKAARCLLKLSESMTQRRCKGDSVCTILQSLIASEYSGVKEDCLHAVIVKLVASCAVSCLSRRLHAEAPPAVFALGNSARQASLDFLEELVFTQRTARALRAVSSASSSGLLKSLAQHTASLTGNALYVYWRIVAQPDIESNSEPIERTPVWSLLLAALNGLLSDSPVSASHIEALAHQCRGVLSVCTTTQQYECVFDSFAEKVFHHFLEHNATGSLCGGEAERWDAAQSVLLLLREATQNRRRRLCFDAYSVRSFLLVHLARRVIGAVSESCRSAEAPMRIDMIEAALETVFNILHGSFCSFGVFMLYSDHSFPELLSSMWSLVSTISVADCLAHRELGSTLIGVLKHLASQPFFDWFWKGLASSEVSAVLATVMELAFRPQVFLSDEDSQLHGEALAVLQPFASSCLDREQKSSNGTVHLPAAILSADSLFLERVVAHCVSQLIIKGSTQAAVKPFDKSHIESCSRLLVSAMRSSSISYGTVEESLISALAPHSSAAAAHGVRQSFASLQTTVMSITSSQLPRANVVEIAEQFIASLDGVIHFS